MDNSTKKFLSGSMIYFLGNALTQLVSLLLMRFVTGNITPEEYGFFNLILTISNLAIPFVTLQMAEAAFKFVLKSQNYDEKKQYFSTCFIIAFIGIILIFAITYGISYVITPVPNTLLVALYISSYSLYTIYQKIVRALNRNKVFAVGNILKTAVFLVLEIIFISMFDMGVEALFLAHTISMCILLIYQEMQVHALKYFDIRTIRRPVVSNMLKFSVPLIPNAAFWWMTSSINHVIVSAKLGMDVNGIYTVSGKFTSVVVAITGVLNMSWQDTAVADYGNDGFSIFFTKTFNLFVKLIFSAIAVLIPFVYILLPYMVDSSYHDAITFVPFMLITSAISAMSGFVAQIFTGQGKTQNILFTSFYGMGANLFVVFFLIGKIGLWAAVLGSLTSDIVLVGTRTYLARKEFAKGIDYKSFILIFAMLVIGILLFLYSTLMVNILWFAVTAIIALVLNQEFIKDIFILLVGGLRKKKEEKA